MNKIKRSVGDRAFDTFNIILQIVIAVVMIYPMLYVLFASFSDPMAFVAHKGVLWHSIGFTFNSYKAAFENPMLLKGYSNTLFVLVFGVTVNIIMTICGAYFLSRKNVKYQKIIRLVRND